MSRFSVAFWATIMPSFAFSFFLISSYFFLDTFSVMRPDIEPIIASFFGVFWLVFFSSRLAIAVFNPWAPKWRLVHVSDRGSRQLVAAFVAMTVINGLDYGLSSIAQTLGSPVELSVLKGWCRQAWSVSSCSGFPSFVRFCRNPRMKPPRVAVHGRSGQPSLFGSAASG